MSEPDSKSAVDVADAGTAELGENNELALSELKDFVWQETKAPTMWK